MKAIILAGGSGSRLYPATRVTSKMLLPVYDKPLIYYPMSFLIEAGIDNILIISSPDQLDNFRFLFGDGNRLGISIEYTVQEKAEGIAQALLLAENFTCGDQVCLVLGDNVFFGGEVSKIFKQTLLDNIAATVFAYPVRDPSRFGVVDIDCSGKAISLVEKPHFPKSNLAVPGVYIYDGNAVNIAKNLKKSDRGEYEITDVNLNYLERYELQVVRLKENVNWYDAGTENSLMAVSNHIYEYQKSKNVLVGSPEQAAYKSGFIDHKQLELTISNMPVNNYRENLEKLLVST